MCLEIGINSKDVKHYNGSRIFVTDAELSYLQISNEDNEECIVLLRYQNDKESGILCPSQDSGFQHHIINNRVSLQIPLPVLTDNTRLAANCEGSFAPSSQVKINKFRFACLLSLTENMKITIALLWIP